MSKQEMPLILHIIMDMVLDSKVLTYAKKPICTTIVSKAIGEYNEINVDFCIIIPWIQPKRLFGV